MTADNTAICEIAGGHFLRLRAIALALRGPPLQWPFSTFRADGVVPKGNHPPRYARLPS